MAKNFGRVAAGAAVAGAALLIRWLSTRNAPEAATSTSDTVAPTKEMADDEIEEDPGMATLGEVELSIRKVEKLDVAFVHQTGRDARSNKRGFTPYMYQYKLSDDYTVSNLINKRLAGPYEHHGLKIVVKYADGAIAMGGTRLGKVRETFK
jgi:hypothetical protein